MAYQLVQCGVCSGKRKILDYMGQLCVCWVCDGKGWCETDNGPHVSENKGHNSAVERANEVIHTVMQTPLKKRGRPKKNEQNG